MSNLIIRVHDTVTNEITERFLNSEEKTLHDADYLAWQKSQEELKNAEIKKMALLEKLGITAEEAKLLIQ